MGNNSVIGQHGQWVRSILVISFFFSGVQAFFGPTSSACSGASCRSAWQGGRIGRRCCNAFARALRSGHERREVIVFSMTQEVEEKGSSAISDGASEKAAQLRALAADLRAQAEELEAARASERREAARQAFQTFDTNDDGTVDLKELITGLESQLRQDFVKRMTKTIGRKPSEAEVEARISEMPGGVLLPEELGQTLIEIYDKNGDGVLQPSEFVPREDMRLRLQGLFDERAQEARLAAAAVREKEIEDRGALKAKEAARERGLPAPEDFNDAPPTAVDKVLSALPYTLPLMDSLVFASHMFQTFGSQLDFLAPIVGTLLVYRSLPFSGLFLFFGIQWFASKPEVNKLVRYNCRQAVNLDIAMFLPSLLSIILQFSLGEDFKKLAPLASAGSDIIFVTVVVCVLYSIGSSALGIQPENLPLISKFNRERIRGRDGDDDKGK